MSRFEFVPRSWLAEVTAGVVTSFRRVVLCLAIAPVIYSGSLAPYLGTGIVLLLACAGVAMAVLALRSSYPGASGGPQDTPAAILFTVATSLAASPASATPQRAFATTLAVLVLGSFLLGMATYLLGRFRLGRVVQFIPYPVIGGFMAGTGWLLLGSGIKVTTDLSATFDNAPRLLQWSVLLHWLPAVAAGVLLFALMRRYRHAATLPVTLIAMLVAFYVVATACGLRLDDLKAQGWLLAVADPVGGGIIGPPVSLDDVDIGFILSALPTLLSLVALSSVQTLLNVSALEVVTGHEVDADTELRATGLANLLSAPLAGLPSYISLGSTVLAWRAGARTRWLGVVGGACCLLVAALGPHAMAYAPKIVLGALIFMEAFDRLYEWLIDSWRRMAWFEYGIVLVILAAIVVVGFLPGILLGMLVVVFVFVADYSRVNPVKTALSLGTIRSTVSRSPVQQQVLDRNAERALVLRLHGFIFFGTAGALYRELKVRARFPERERSYVLIDFRDVTGVDGSTGFQFAKIGRWLHRRNLVLVLTHVSPAVAKMLARAGVAGRRDTEAFATLDLALEWVEDCLINESGVEADATDVMQHLGALVGDTKKAAKLLPYLEPLTFPAGHPIIVQGEKGDDIYFIERGSCSAAIRAADGSTIRLRKFGPGAFFGEMALYMGQTRTASVVADTNVKLRRINGSALAELADRDPGALSAFHELMARAMAERIAFQNRRLAAE